MDSLKSKLKDHWIIVALVVTAISIVYYGFDVKIRTVSMCWSKAVFYVQANFSETTIRVDFEGDPYAASDNWSERVSDVYYVEMRDGKIIDSNADYVAYLDIVIPTSNLPYSKASSTQPNFDNFTTNKKIDIYQYLSNKDKVSIGAGEYSKCVSNIDRQIFVSYWYGLTY